MTKMKKNEKAQSMALWLLMLKGKMARESQERNSRGRTREWEEIRWCHACLKQ